MSWIHNPYAARNTPEARQEIEAIRAENKAKATESLRREVQRYAPRLLPGAVDRIVEKEGTKLAGGDAATQAVRVHEFMNSPAADRLKRPEAAPVREQVTVDFDIDRGGPPVVRPSAAPKPAGPKGDALRAALALYASDFKTPALVEKFYNEYALEYAHAEPSAAVAFVAGAMASRQFRAYQKREAEPSAGTLRLVEALKPFDAMLKAPLLDIAEGELSDLAGPNVTPNVKELTRWVEGRLKARPDLLIGGEFDPQKVARPERPAVQVAPQQAPPAEKTWAELNAEHFARTGGI